MRNKITNKIIAYLRRVILYINRKRLKNKDISLIANNCIGGIIYHDLQLRFLSPTINLYFDNAEFILFCLHIKEYLSLPVELCEKYDKSFPVGVIHGSHGDVHIFFMHYNSFEEAIAIWNERKSRVNYDNLYIIMEAQLCEDSILNKFNEIPHEQKVVLTSGKRNVSQSFPIDETFYTNNYVPGKILEYSPCGMHRYMDALDYVKWFNSGKIRKRYI